MAPRRPDKKSKKRDKAAISRAAAAGSESRTAPSPAVLLKAAEFHLQEGNAPDAAKLAQNALDQSSGDGEDALAALNILGQINLELGEFEAARSCLMRAASIDEDGTISEEKGGGPEKFLCLAQLSEDGGQDSVRWFEKGASALKSQIQALEEQSNQGQQRRRTTDQDDETAMHLEELKQKLAMTLCSVAEVYMTDLSWEEDAEQRCETLVTEATMVAPDFPETWQTLANVRISQTRLDDARAALTRSLNLWKDLTPEDPAVPDFPSRVALARLLMEVEMDQEAIEVLERLVGEDDHSVEVWYLGGWGLFVMGEKQRQSQQEQGKNASSDAAEGEDDWKASWISSRVWLNQCLHLYQMQDYEDDRLGAHAKELLASINKELGEAPAGEGEEDEWVDEGSDDEMQE